MLESAPVLANEQHVFPLLARPNDYVRCQWNLVEMADMRRYWCDLFRSHFPSMMEQHISASYDHELAQAQATVAGEQYFAWIESVEDGSGRERLDIIDFCVAREQALAEAGIDDPCRCAKSRENEAAMKHLPALFQELDALDEQARAWALLRGVFAGNIFDLGATETVERFRDQNVDFHDIRGTLKERPWLIDGADAWMDRWLSGKPHHCAVMFVDNAGADVILGMIPFCRAMLQRGTTVIMTANDVPSLNDITADELNSLMRRIVAIDATFRRAACKEQLMIVPSGNGLPLIDLKDVSLELVKTVTWNDVDLVILEGMGRAVESNLQAEFTCDCLKLAMLKDRGVAGALDGEVYDLVCRFDEV